MLKLAEIIEAYQNATPEEQEYFIKLQIQHSFFEERINDAIDKFVISGGSLLALVDGVKVGDGLSAEKNDVNINKILETK